MHTCGFYHLQSRGFTTVSPLVVRARSRRRAKAALAYYLRGERGERMTTRGGPFLAAAASLPLLLATRAVMGLGEGVALPCMNNLTARWVPKAERSRAVAACMGGFQSGSMVGLLAAPAMLAVGRGTSGTSGTPGTASTPIPHAMTRVHV